MAAQDAVELVEALTPLALELAARDVVVAELHCDWANSKSWTLEVQKGADADTYRKALLAGEFDTPGPDVLRVRWDAANEEVCVERAPTPPLSSPGPWKKEHATKADLDSALRFAQECVKDWARPRVSRWQRLWGRSGSGAHDSQHASGAVSESAAAASKFVLTLSELVRRLSAHGIVVRGLAGYWSGFGSWSLQFGLATEGDQNPLSPARLEESTVLSIHWDGRERSLLIDRELSTGGLEKAESSRTEEPLANLAAAIQRTEEYALRWAAKDDAR